MATPQEEATQLFADVVRDLSGLSPDLKSALRRCQHACTLLDWSTDRDWFLWELNGYPEGIPTPQYRIGQGEQRWNIQGIPTYTLLRAAFSGANMNDTATIPTQGEFRGDIDGLIAGQSQGYSYPTGRTVPGYMRDIGNYTLQEVRAFPAGTYQGMVKAIEGRTYNFASQAYRTLRYGNALTDIWTAYRIKADAALQKLGMNNHLDAIQSGLRSDNPESWRNAVFGCRNVLEDLSNYLWRDERPTYEYLPGSGRGGKLAVDKGKVKNRLTAYIHQKGLSGTQGAFLRDEVERLDASLRSLYEIASTAHGSLTLDQARTVALATYFLVGELAQRTDMQPVEKYGLPAVPDAG